MDSLCTFLKELYKEPQCHQDEMDHPKKISDRNLPRLGDSEGAAGREPTEIERKMQNQIVMSSGLSGLDISPRKKGRFCLLHPPVSELGQRDQLSSFYAVLSLVLDHSTLPLQEKPTGILST